MFLLMKMPEVSVNKLALLALAVVALGMSACTQCEDCELNGNTERICETEFDNPDQYYDAIADKEAGGATCTAVGF